LEPGNPAEGAVSTSFGVDSIIIAGQIDQKWSFAGQTDVFLNIFVELQLTGKVRLSINGTNYPAGDGGAILFG